MMGKIEYDVEFLKSRSNHPFCMKKPNLPPLEIVLDSPIQRAFLPNASLTTVRIRNKLHNTDDAGKNNFSISHQTNRTSLSKRNSNSSKERKKSLLPLSTIAENSTTKAQHLEDMKYLLWKEKYVKEIDENSMPDAENRTLLFSSSVFDARKLLELEANNHMTQGNNLLFYQTKLLGGDFIGLISEAAEKKQLTDWHVAKAPYVSRSFWHSIVLKYAKQLEESGDIINAASNLITIHKVREGIRLLIKHNYFKEALIVAKLRTVYDDTIIKDIINAWVKEKIRLCNYEAAAKGLISLGKFKDARDLLGRKKNDENQLPNLLELLKILESLYTKDDKTGQNFCNLSSTDNDSEKSNFVNDANIVKISDNIQTLIDKK